MERARSVVTATENGGADCPALSQSKPCNTQPCLSVSFGKGYCSTALRECTKARALIRGCGATPKSFGNANKLSGTYVNDAKKTESEIDKIDPPGAGSEREAEPDADETNDIPADKPDDQNPDVPEDTDESVGDKMVQTKQKKSSTKPKQASTTTKRKPARSVDMGHFASDRPKAPAKQHAGDTKSQAKPKAHKVDMGFPMNDINSAVADEIRQIRNAGNNVKASVQFEFPRDQAPATVHSAVQAAITSAKNSNRGQYNYKIGDDHHDEEQSKVSQPYTRPSSPVSLETPSCSFAALGWMSGMAPPPETRAPHP